MIRENINKIDYDLKNLFESVKISEKSNKGNYFFEVVASSKKAQVRAEISRPELNNSVVKWSYYVNPLNESSDKIERISSIENAANDIFEIVSKKKMDSSYFESLETTESVELINESLENIDEKGFYEKVSDIFKKFQIEEKLVEESKANLDGDKPEKTLVFKKELRASEKFNLDTELKSIGVEYVSFVGDTIKVKL